MLHNKCVKTCAFAAVANSGIELLPCTLQTHHKIAVVLYNCLATGSKHVGIPHDGGCRVVCVDNCKAGRHTCGASSRCEAKVSLHSPPALHQASAMPDTCKEFIGPTACLERSHVRGVTCKARLSHVPSHVWSRLFEHSLASHTQFASCYHTYPLDRHQVRGSATWAASSSRRHY